MRAAVSSTGSYAALVAGIVGALLLLLGLGFVVFSLSTDLYGYAVTYLLFALVAIGALAPAAVFARRDGRRAQPAPRRQRRPRAAGRLWGVLGALLFLLWSTLGVAALGVSTATVLLAFLLFALAAALVAVEVGPLAYIVWKSTRDPLV